MFYFPRPTLSFNHFSASQISMMHKKCQALSTKRKHKNRLIWHFNYFECDWACVSIGTRLFHRMARDLCELSVVLPSKMSCDFTSMLVLYYAAEVILGNIYTDKLQLTKPIYSTKSNLLPVEILLDHALDTSPGRHICDCWCKRATRFALSDKHVSNCSM